VVDHHQREQPVCLRLVRHERGEHSPQPDGFGGEVDPAAVALVVDQVDDGQHRIEAVRKQVERLLRRFLGLVEVIRSQDAPAGEPAREAVAARP
jgi:hypothetical protein